jgi:hypothetical protein
MIEQPAGREDVPADDERHRRVQHLKRNRKAQIFRKFECTADLPKPRLQHRIESRFLRPRCDGAAQLRFAGFVPV